MHGRRCSASSWPNCSASTGQLVCHSLSCLLWLALATEIPGELRPSRLLLALRLLTLMCPAAGQEFIRSFSAKAASGSATGELRFVCSDNDPYNPSSAAGMYGVPSNLMGFSQPILCREQFAVLTTAMPWPAGHR